MGSGAEGVVVVFVSELFSSRTVGRDVRRRFRGGVLGALLDSGSGIVLRRQYAVATHTTATGWKGRGAVQGS